MIMSKTAGKRANEEYVQASAYVRRDVRRRVRVQMAKHDYAGDYSDLVNYLLKTWVEREEQKDRST